MGTWKYVLYLVNCFTKKKEEICILGGEMLERGVGRRMVFFFLLRLDLECMCFFFYKLIYSFKTK